jgi:hypothetical protein
MPVSSLIQAPVNVNHTALAALERVMLGLDYCGRARSDARKIVARTGCVADACPSCIDPEHLAVCEAEYVNSLPHVRASDLAWDDRGVWLDLDSIQEAAAGRFLAASIVPPELDPDDSEYLDGHWPGD